jgi:CDP-diacylglycerol--glycerol-3-phosphate 3-phosphatidyltransferase
MTVPNAITIARIALIPLFLWLAYAGSRGAAVGSFVVFGVASGSDLVDGYIARRHALVSRLGEFLDPLADKLLVFAALFVLVDVRAFPLWVALVIVVREVGVQLIRILIVRRGGRLPASQAAKLKTATQIALVSWWLLPWEQINAGHWILVALALATTLWSGAEYLVGYLKVKEVTS